jgi:glutathione synthase
MDPIESIKPHKDSTLALLLEARNRGWEAHYGQLQDIWLRDGEAFGRLTRIEVADDPAEWFELGDVTVTPLGEMDVILMRKDPPFNVDYVVATYVLERAEDRGALVVNRPQGLRDANEKAFLAWFPDCAPPTLISRSLKEMQAFIAEHHKVVVKPLHCMAGQSVFVTDAEDGNHNVIVETVTRGGSRFAMVQEYVSEIAQEGDKRILLVDGEPIPLALARIPPAGDHRGNLATGARTEVRPLTKRDLWICEQIRPVLQDKGLLFTGIDVIGDFMTEINVTSPTGIREIEHASDVPVAARLMDVIQARSRVATDGMGRSGRSRAGR